MRPLAVAAAALVSVTASAVVITLRAGRSPEHGTLALTVRANPVRVYTLTFGG